VEVSIGFGDESGVFFSGFSVSVELGILVLGVSVGFEVG